MHLKRTFLALAASAALLSSAFAADLPAAPVRQSALQYPTASGWFWGVSTSALGGSASSSVANTSGTVIGGRFGIDGGYTGVIGATFWFVEGSVSGQTLTGASNALSVKTSLNFQERFALGVPQATWASVLNLIPGLSSVAFPTLPALGGTVGPAAPYIFGSLYQDDVSASLGVSTGKAWLLSYGAGVGILNRLNNGMMLDTSIEYKHGANGIVVGAAKVQPFEDTYLATVRLKF